MVPHAGAQGSEQEDQGGVERVEFSVRRLRPRPAWDAESGGPSFSASRSSVHLEEGRGGRDSMQWQSPTDWGPNRDGAAAAGTGGLSTGVFGSNGTGLRTGVFGSNGMGLRTGTGRSVMGGAPVSRANVSAASIAPRQGARTGVGRLTLGGAPMSTTSCGTMIAPVSPATVTAAGMAPRPGANQPRSPLALPKFIPIGTASAP
ncbi:unnamed protein product [Ectocarpus sp. CCAP 1310/34]|nr:unnamed protein product [Ectocarpus sp. CCAP 1310/34]